MKIDEIKNTDHAWQGIYLTEQRRLLGLLTFPRHGLHNPTSFTA